MPKITRLFSAITTCFLLAWYAHGWRPGREGIAVLPPPTAPAVTVDSPRDSRSRHTVALPPDGWCAHAARLSDFQAPSRANDFSQTITRIAKMGVGCIDLDATPYNRTGRRGRSHRVWAIGHPRDLERSEEPEHFCSVSHLSRILFNSFSMTTSLRHHNPGSANIRLKLFTLEPKLGGLGSPKEQLRALQGLTNELNQHNLLESVTIVAQPAIAIALNESKSKHSITAKLALPVRDDQQCAPMGTSEEGVLSAYSVVMPSVACWARDDVRSSILAWQAAGNSAGIVRQVSVWTVDDLDTARAVTKQAAGPNGRRSSQPYLVSNRVDTMLKSANRLE